MDELIQEWRNLNEAMNRIMPGTPEETKTCDRLDEIEAVLGRETVNQLMDETY